MSRNRNSSVEFFRIIATFLVLIVHFNGWFVPIPKHFSGWTLPTVGQSIIESFSIICVNSFLVITGWYGIKLKIKSLISLYTVIAWIYVTFYLAECLAGREFSEISFLWNIIALTKESYYIQSYMLLMIVSPILNSFITQYGNKSLNLILAIWGTEIVLDFGFNNKCLGFGHGFQFMHFVVMYLLGQIAYLYRDVLFKVVKSYKGLLLYVICSLMIWIGYVYVGSKVFYYSNPLNVIASFSLFLFFVQKEFQNNFINWVSASTLSVYIIHITSPVNDILTSYDLRIFNDYGYGEYLIKVSACIIGVFIFGILFDKIRSFIFDISCMGYLSAKTILRTFIRRIA